MVQGLMATAEDSLAQVVEIALEALTAVALHVGVGRVPAVLDDRHALAFGASDAGALTDAAQDVVAQADIQNLV